MALPIPTSYAAMESRLVADLPSDDGWQFEPKWDGFRCLVFRDGDQVALQSKSGQALARYFPEVVERVHQIAAPRFVLDGELVVPIGDHLSFDDLLQRIHPAVSRIARLARESPALLILFDLLVDAAGNPRTDQPLRTRRRDLETFSRQYLKQLPGIRLSPATSDRQQALRWLAGSGDAVDGIVAKRCDQAYQSGERAMLKIKQQRSADCVVGGFRYASAGKVVGSLLLGLYDGDGALHHVGFCSGLKAHEKQKLTPQLEALVQPPGFTGRAPGGPSRWSSERSAEWQPLSPELVVEVGYDHFSGGRFRHGTRLLRWRPDKNPRQCLLDQVEREGRIAPLRLLAEKDERHAAA